MSNDSGYESWQPLTTVDEYGVKHRFRLYRDRETGLMRVEIEDSTYEYVDLPVADITRIFAAIENALNRADLPLR